MKKSSNNKPIIIAVVIFGLVMMVYQLFLKPDTSIDTTVTLENTEGVGADVVKLDESLQLVSLDRSLFSTTAYKALVDFTTDVSPQPIGRTNPFGPIGSE